MRATAVGTETVKGGDAERCRKIGIAHPAGEGRILQSEAHLGSAGPGMFEERCDARGLAIGRPVDAATHGNSAVRIVRSTQHDALYDLPGIDGGRYPEIDGG